MLRFGVENCKDKEFFSQSQLWALWIPFVDPWFRTLGWECWKTKTYFVMHRIKTQALQNASPTWLWGEGNRESEQYIFIPRTWWAISWQENIMLQNEFRGGLLRGPGSSAGVGPPAGSHANRDRQRPPQEPPCFLQEPLPSLLFRMLNLNTWFFSKNVITLTYLGHSSGGTRVCCHAGVMEVRGQVASRAPRSTLGHTGRQAWPQALTPPGPSQQPYLCLSETWNSKFYQIRTISYIKHQLVKSVQCCNF